MNILDLVLSVLLLLWAPGEKLGFFIFSPRPVHQKEKIQWLNNNVKTLCPKDVQYLLR